MNSVRLAGVAGLALLLGACGGGSEEASAPAGQEGAGTEAAPPQTGAAAAPVAGEAPAAFAQCRACHSVEPGRHGIGPSLAGVFGTKAGEIEGYQFSTAMLESGLTWDEATLHAYLENPQKMVPGTKMSFFGMKDAAKRQEVIDYLKTL